MNSLKHLHFLTMMALLAISPGFLTATAGNFPLGTGLEAKIQYGFVIRHHLDMGLYSNRRFTAAELNLTFQTEGDKPWHQAYALPEYGIAYFYSDLGNTPILGNVHALLPWVRFPLVKGGSYRFSLRAALGAGYLNKPFDRKDNFKNLSIGSHVNPGIQFHFESRIKVSDKLFINGGFSFTHFSNGAIKSPNYGINLPMLTAGLLYFPNPRTTVRQLADMKLVDKQWEARISVQNGIKQIEPLLGPQYYVIAFSGDFVKPVTLKSRLGFGADLFFDTSDQANLEQDGDTLSNVLEVVKPGIKGIYELDLGRLRMNFEIGVYVYGRDQGDGFLYDKLGLKYFVTKSAFMSFTLKSHYARADFIAVGLGYKLPLGL